MKKYDKNIKDYEILNDLLLVNFSDESEVVIPLRLLRDRCPCAGCEGETDALGNLYKSTPQAKTDASYELIQVLPVGYYGLKPLWADNHTTGIFTMDLLIELSEK
tara:strand:+ start:1173 stop:1487 length:315 start_codon:yes stop_codon:yes gene_type:complete